MIDTSTENMYGIKLFVTKDLKQNNVWGSFNKTELGEGAVNVSRVNQTIYSLSDDEYIFDRTDVRAIFITLYTIVFCCCFFGKQTHLIFCVVRNMSSYLKVYYISLNNILHGTINRDKK